MLHRRQIVAWMAAGSAAPRILPALAQATPAVDVVDRIAFDLQGEPSTIHPAKAYSDTEWSIVHSVYDALVGFDGKGALRPVAAARFELNDDLTWEVELRRDLTFHDGSPVTSAAIARGFDLVSGSDSLVADIFSVVTDVEIIDDAIARIIVSAPSPWLPAQMASWHVLIPEAFDELAPVGSGPYRFGRWEQGQQIALARFEDYQPSVTKGAPIAAEAIYRFVPEAATRVADVVSGSADVATFVPFDLVGALTGADVPVHHTPVAGSRYIRIATDTPPFDDVRVRQALNLALDLDAFPGALIHDGSTRLATVQSGPESMGYDHSLMPFAYDPDRAAALLAEAGVADLQVQLEVTSDSPIPVCEAIVAQWAEVGISAEIVLSDAGAFNAGWTDTSAPPLRMFSWSPLFDPSTLLSFVWRSGGLLSRYGNTDVDALIDASAIETESDARADLYRQVGHALHDDAAAVFLWNLVHVSGVTEKAHAWSPRADQWILPLAR